MKSLGFRSSCFSSDTFGFSKAEVSPSCLPSTKAFISLEIFPDFVCGKGTPTKLMYLYWKENRHHKPYLNSNILKLMSKGG